MIKLTKRQAVEYKKKWRQVELAQVLELRKTPMPLKLKQLCLLMNSFHFMPLDKVREKEVGTICGRWAKIREKWKNEKQ